MGKSDPPTADINILIVDDLATVREELEAILQLTAGFNVLGTAVDGLEAVTLAESLKPDIVLMDIELPGLDGIAAARQIKSRRLAKVVVVLSIHRRSQHLRQAQAAGVDAYVEKGEGVETLVQTLNRVWREQAPSSSELFKVDS